MFDFILVPDSLNLAAFVGLIIISGFTSMLTASLGIGGGTLLLTVMAQLLPVQAVIPVHGVVQLGSNTGRALVMFKEVHWQHVLWFALGSILGALIGGQVAVSLPIAALQIGLAIFIIFTVWGPKFDPKFADNKTLFVGGIASTFLTMFIGATGPFVLAIIRAFKMDRLNLVATNAVCLVLQHFLKILVFGLLGFAFTPYAPLLLLMVCSGFVGTIVGKKLLIKIDEQRFQYWLNGILTVLAFRLIWVALF